MEKYDGVTTYEASFPVKSSSGCTSLSDINVLEI